MKQYKVERGQTCKWVVAAHPHAAANRAFRPPASGHYAPDATGAVFVYDAQQVLITRFRVEDNG